MSRAAARNCEATTGIVVGDPSQFQSIAAVAVPATSGPMSGNQRPTSLKPQGIGPVAISSPKKSPDHEAGRKVVGNDRAHIARRDDLGVENSLTATATTGQKVVHPLTERDMAKRVAVVARCFQRGQLAQAANTTKEAARNWQDETSCPNLARTINMARKIPAVAELVISEIVGDENGPHALNAVIAGLHIVSAMPGPEGSAARALLTRLMRSD